METCLAAEVFSESLMCNSNHSSDGFKSLDGSALFFHVFLCIILQIPALVSLHTELTRVYNMMCFVRCAAGIAALRFAREAADLLTHSPLLRDALAMRSAEVCVCVCVCARAPVQEHKNFHLPAPQKRFRCHSDERHRNK